MSSNLIHSPSLNHSNCHRLIFRKPFGNSETSSAAAGIIVIEGLLGTEGSSEVCYEAIKLLLLVLN